MRTSNIHHLNTVNICVYAVLMCVCVWVCLWCVCLCVLCEVVCVRGPRTLRDNSSTETDSIKTVHVRARHGHTAAANVDWN